MLFSYFLENNSSYNFILLSLVIKLGLTYSNVLGTSIFLTSIPSKVSSSITTNPYGNFILVSFLQF
jgi:hypothetical protein